MKTQITYERLNPDTTNGEAIKVTAIYSSFDKHEIDALEDVYVDKIGSGVVVEIKDKGGDSE